jgi:hypothetical protein
MRLTDVLARGGRQLMIAGLIAMAVGWLVVPLQALLNQAPIPWNQILITMAISAAVIGAIHMYQRQIFWRRLRRQLLEAPVESTAPTNAYPQMKPWAWAAFAAFAFIMAYGFTAAFPIFGGSLLVGYGSAGSWLASNVSGVEANRVTYYTMPDTTAKPRRAARSRLVRVVRDEALAD